MAQAVDRRKTEKKEELVEKLVHINRVAKTVKGGRNMSFAAVVVVGDQKGRVGYGSGKAAEVPEAITKATNEAKKNMVRIPLREGRTLHHDAQGHFGAGKVVLRTAPAGTGVIAGGPMRAIFEVLGVQDVVAKSLGSNNPYNMIKATLTLCSRFVPREWSLPREARKSVTSSAAEKRLPVQRPKRGGQTMANKTIKSQTGRQSDRTSGQAAESRFNRTWFEQDEQSGRTGGHSVDPRNDQQNSASCQNCGLISRSERGGNPALLKFRNYEIR